MPATTIHRGLHILWPATAPAGEFIVAVRSDQADAAIKFFGALVLKLLRYGSRKGLRARCDGRDIETRPICGLRQLTILSGRSRDGEIRLFQMRREIVK